MLETLRRIVQEVNSAPDLTQALKVIVHRVKRAMGSDVCSVYLVDRRAGENILMATEGLDPNSVGHVRLPLSEGLIGLVTRKAEPVNLHDAASHACFSFIPETGEHPFHGFLGVPIIRHRAVLGVLVVQKREPHQFDENQVSAMVTLAAQLAGAITHAELSGGLLHSQDQPRLGDLYLKGRPGAPGVTFGQVVVVYPPADLSAIPDRHTDQPEAEIEAIKRAIDGVVQDLGRLKANIDKMLPAEDRALFDAYVMMLRSDSLMERTAQRIKAGNWAPGALRETINEHARVFTAMDDEYLQERATDIRDLGRRILVRLQANRSPQPEFPANTILVGEEVSAIQLTEVPAGHLAGVISAHGSGSSHVAILARALGIPAVMGVADLPVARLDGREVIVDGYRGRINVTPSETVRQEYLRIIQEEAELSRGLKTLRDKPAETADGHRIHLYLNAGLLADLTPSLESGADGIGLYRTEFPFMVRDRFPSEETQLQVYRKVLESYTPRPVTLRTLDIGGDKSLPYFPVREENPFLGWRGMRIMLDHPDLFLTQMRAMLRASIGLGNLQILFPMISGVRQLDEALRFLQQVYEELLEEGYQITMPRRGVMVEVPSAVYQAEALAQRVDFLSIGSNDLTQYLLAVDRNNARVAELYDSLDPAVLRAVLQVIEGANRHRVEVSVCGEMAGDPAAALLLLGMGIHSLSMSAGSLPRVKSVIRSITMIQAKTVLNQCLQLNAAVDVRTAAEQALDALGLGSLIRAGK